MNIYNCCLPYNYYILLLHIVCAYAETILVLGVQVDF